MIVLQYCLTAPSKLLTLLTNPIVGSPNATSKPKDSWKNIAEMRVLFIFFRLFFSHLAV